MVTSARHRWNEPAGFVINRPVGVDSYTFLHFFTPTELRVGEKTVKTRPGACILYRPHTPQWFRSEQPLVHDWMHLSADAGREIERFSVPTDTVVYPPDCAFLTSGINEIELEIYGDRPNSAELADAAAVMLLIRFARACEEHPSACPVNPETRARMIRFRSELLARRGEQWSVERMAREVNLSPSRFYAVYRALFAVSPVNDLIRARIDAAKSALTCSDESIASLADRLGYANITHFSRQFRRHTGVSPREYAKK